MAEVGDRGDVVVRYLELGLRLGRHLDGMVDAYYGPPELEERVGDEPLRPLPALVADSAGLISALDAGEGELDETRRRWIRAQLVGMHASGRKLRGDDLGYVDEVEQCYGVRPEFVDHEVLADAHCRLDKALPGSGDLAERYELWRHTHLMTPAQLSDAVAVLAEAFRARTAELFGLPDGEEVQFDLVSDQPWSGFNYYRGDLRSTVAINTDLPVSSTAIGHLVAHEAYPGHHTEHCRKEVGLVRRRQQLEESIFLVGTPQCLVAEGLADLGIEVLLGSERHRVLAGLLHPLGIRYDTEVIAAVAEAGEALSAVRANAALIVHDRGGSHDDGVEELVRWGLLDRARATKSMSFLTHPTWRAYVFCYVAGLPLCRTWVSGDTGRFERLLSEQFVPEDLAS